MSYTFEEVIEINERAGEFYTEFSRVMQGEDIKAKNEMMKIMKTNMLYLYKYNTISKIVAGTSSDVSLWIRLRQSYVQRICKPKGLVEPSHFGKIKKISKTFNLDEKCVEWLSKMKTRAGKCHWGTIELVRRLHSNKQKYDADYRVVTGLNTIITDQYKYLHTWLEYESPKGEPLVADFTMNAIMPKEYYYWLRNAEPIHEIPDKTILQDKDILDSCFIEIKRYLFNRDEYVKSETSSIVPKVDNSEMIEKLIKVGKQLLKRRVEEDREL